MKIRFLPASAADKEIIREYLSRHCENAANKFFAVLKKRIANLKKFPYSCPAYEHDPDYRKLIIGDYIVFYMVNEDENIIEIHRIFHSAQNIRRYLKYPGV